MNKVVTGQPFFSIQFTFPFVQIISFSNAAIVLGQSLNYNLPGSVKT